MTKCEYLTHLAMLYYQANNSDTEQAQEWQRRSDCAIHCRAIEIIVSTMLTGDELANWLEIYGG
ncbi:MAG: hypothetical protein GY943_34760 [Chloroflexi bacterium]|nr:hypothetical protein [Chloroflexota bacterium]